MYNSLCNSSDKITLFVLPTTAGVKYADLDLKMCQQLIVLRWIMDGGYCTLIDYQIESIAWRLVNRYV